MKLKTKKFQKDGFFNTDVSITTKPYLDSTGVEISKDMHIEIDRGKRVKVKSITFEGNEHFQDGKLRRAMKKTKRKNIARVWKRSKFTEEGFEEDKASIIKKYKANSKIASSKISLVPSRWELTAKGAKTSLSLEFHS